MQCFCLAMSVHNRDPELLDYLLNRHWQLWNSECLGYILRGTISEQWAEGVKLVLGGQCAIKIYSGMDYFQRVDFIGERVGQFMSDPTAKELLVDLVCEQPFAGVALTFLVKDSSISKTALEKCLGNQSIDDLEMLYNNEIDSVPEVVRLLLEAGLDRDLVRSAMAFEGKEIRDKA